VVIVAPPAEPGAVYVTVAVVEPVAVATPIVGALGTVAADEAATVIVVVPVALVDVVAVIVYVAEAVVAKAVPLITPVLVFKESPDGREGEILHTVAVSPEFVGVKEVIAVPTIALIVDGVYEIIGTGCAVTETVTVLVSLPAEFVAVTTNAVGGNVAVGVPEN
jgi:hypothetical protein